jgi:hypothetical protein
VGGDLCLRVLGCYDTLVTDTPVLWLLVAALTVQAAECFVYDDRCLPEVTTELLSRVVCALVDGCCSHSRGLYSALCGRWNTTCVGWLQYCSRLSASVVSCHTVCFGVCSDSKGCRVPHAGCEHSMCA